MFCQHKTKGWSQEHKRLECIDCGKLWSQVVAKEQKKMLEAVDEYSRAQHNLKSIMSAKFNMVDTNKWAEEIKTGHVTDPRLAEWLRNLANYYGEKDRPFATYMEGLYK